MLQVKYAVHVALATIAVAAAYELKDAYLWRTPERVVVLVVITYVLTSFVAAGVAGLLFRFVLVRMLVLRRSWVEGYWHIQTYRPKRMVVSAPAPLPVPAQVSEPALPPGTLLPAVPAETSLPVPVTPVPSALAGPVANGLMHIYYVGRDLELKVTSFKLSAPGSNIETAASSQQVTLDARSLQYLNYFSYHLDAEDIAGIAQGVFYLDGLRPYPTRYHGTLRYFADLPVERQVARKISFWRVRWLMFRHPYDWEKQLLEKLQSGRYDL